MRQPSRLEALAVLRGERDYWGTRGSIYQPAVYALQLAINILSGEAAPSGSSPSADPGIARRNDFIGGLLDG